MRERPELPVNGPGVVDPAVWLAQITRMRGELDSLRPEFASSERSVPGTAPGSGATMAPGPGAGSGIAGSADETHRRALLCDLLASSLGRAEQYLAGLCHGADDTEHGRPDDPGLAAGTYARASVRPPATGCAAPLAVDGAEEASPPWRRPLPEGGLPDQRGSARRHPAATAGTPASAEWHLDRDDARWSDGMYALFGRDRTLGPPAITELAGHAVPEDRDLVGELVVNLVERASGVEAEFRVVREDDGSRVWVQFVGEPVLDATGRPSAVWALVSDITELRGAQQQLTATRAQLMEQRSLVRSEHRIAAELQRVVMPWWTRPVNLPGIEVATRYFPAERESQVGGDWYDALALPDGDVLLAVGDMSGHGLAAASGMTTLRGALRGVAMTGAGPAGVLAALNRIVVHTLPADEVATAVCARFRPADKVLTWAQAGHPPPLLYRDGVGSPLPAPRGVLLGAMDDPRFAEAGVELRSGDLVLAFTDGLVERRGRGSDEAVAALLALGPMLVGGDARASVDIVLTRLGHARYEDDACVMAVCVR